MKSPVLFHFLKRKVSLYYLLEFSENNSQDVWLLDSQHRGYNRVTFGFGTPSSDMIFEIWHFHDDSAYFFI